MKHLTKINDQLYQYNEPLEVDGIDCTIKFKVRFNGDNWYTTFMDVGGDSPTEVVEQVFQLMRDDATEYMESLNERNWSMNEIKVTIKSVYGENKVYPLCDKSRAFADMLNQKTLTMRNIEHIKRIGFTVVVVQDTVTL